MKHDDRLVNCSASGKTRIINLVKKVLYQLSIHVHIFYKNWLMVIFYTIKDTVLIDMLQGNIIKGAFTIRSTTRKKGNLKKCFYMTAKYPVLQSMKQTENNWSPETLESLT
jgi:hypothetical protein